jgi:catechol 2,3-dioxygenase-like lactoylglutathione lyase family enzyme
MVVRADAFGVVVKDMAASLAFYERLGLGFPENAAAEQHVEATLPGGIRLMFDTVELMQQISDYHPATGGHRMGIAFLCDTPAEVDETHAALVAAGHRSIVEPWDAFWGQRYATVLDPDDNPVDLFAPLPD